MCFEEFKRATPRCWWWVAHKGTVHCCRSCSDGRWLAVVSGDTGPGRVFYAGYAPDPHEPELIDSDDYATLEGAMAAYMSLVAKEAA